MKAIAADRYAKRVLENGPADGYQSTITTPDYSTLIERLDYYWRHHRVTLNTNISHAVGLRRLMETEVRILEFDDAVGFLLHLMAEPSVNDPRLRYCIGLMLLPELIRRQVLHRVKDVYQVPGFFFADAKPLNPSQLEVARWTHDIYPSPLHGKTDIAFRNNALKQLIGNSEYYSLLWRYRFECMILQLIPENIADKVITVRQVEHERQRS
ncbi:MAG: hypothetical protein WCK11_02685 [Candidatus Falkowbacteria bacterium]